MGRGPAGGPVGGPAGAEVAAASELALAGLRFPIPADEVIDVMGQIGAEMDEKYRETAKGGA